MKKENTEEKRLNTRIESLSDIILTDAKRYIETSIKYPDRFPNKLDHYFGDSWAGDYDSALRLYEDGTRASLLREHLTLEQLQKVCDLVEYKLKELGVKNCAVKIECGIDIDSGHKGFFGAYVYNKKGYTIHIVGNY